MQGLGAIQEQKELDPSEVVVVVPTKRHFGLFVRDCPLQFGLVVTYYAIKVYFFRWVVTVGMIPSEILWERNG